jgi:hypothetical protein
VRVSNDSVHRCAVLGDPVQPSISAHFWNVPTAPRNVTGMPGTTEEAPPARFAMRLTGV